MIGAEHFYCVAPAKLGDIWPMVAGLIDSAYAELDEPTPDVQKWLIEERGLLWILAPYLPPAACCTTSLVPGREGLACRIVAVAGEQVDWAACMGRIERYAKAEGCYKIIMDGRRGWGKVLSDYRPKCFTFEKRI